MAKSVAYDPAILEAIRGTQLSAELAPIDTPESYYKRAGDVARKQLVAAGLRLAKILSAEQ